MRFSNILLSLTYLFLTNSKTINSYDNIHKRNDGVDSIEYKDFYYKFHCTEDENTCSTIKANLNQALDYLSDTLEIYHPIDFTAYVDSVGMGGPMAYNLDTNFVPLRTSTNENEPPYLYPQALVKQLNLSTKPQFNKTDFSIVFSSDYFDGEDNVRTIIHEILHGLGFLQVGTPNLLNNDNKNKITDIEDENLDPETDMSDVKLFPDPLYDTNIENIDEITTCDALKESVKQKFIGFSPFTIYEKNIVDIHTKKRILEDIGYLYKEFNCVDSTTVDLQDDTLKIKCYESLSDQTKKIISDIPSKYYTRANTIGFLTSKGTVVPLQTFESEYRPSSSICHINLDKEAEFRMATNEISNSKINGVMEKYKDLVDKINNGEINPYEICMDEMSENCIKYNELNSELDECFYMAELEGDEHLKENIHHYYTENFLMYYNAYDRNLSNEFMIESFGDINRHGLIGNGIVEILKTMGWTEKGESKSKDLYYVADDVYYPEQLWYYLRKKSDELNCSMNDEYPPEYPSKYPLEYPTEFPPTEYPTEIPTEIIKAQDSDNENFENDSMEEENIGNDDDDDVVEIFSSDSEDEVIEEITSY